ncbi:hypothetical protein [uncultured Pseudoteredinibacter sp.]|uniref:hypothetical protein n=1 Tax=uncultured Pseudoteredinibacter sp. TaxID=1641701 RepID=UPI002622F3C5|nr:hypothetical protein [uncultured Pseudoteredinibacter sp.]
MAAQLDQQRRDNALLINQQRQDSAETRRLAEVSYLESSIFTNLEILKVRLLSFDSVVNAPLSELILAIYRSGDLTQARVEELKEGLSARKESLVTWVNLSAKLTRLREEDQKRYVDQLLLVSITVDHELCVALDYIVKLTTGVSFEAHFNKKERERSG